MNISRRRFIAAAAGIPTALWGGELRAKTEWDPWADLINALPNKGDLDSVRSKRSATIVPYVVQKIEDAKSEKVNLDFYAVDIAKLPSSLNDKQLLTYIRKNLNDFLDHQYSEFVAYSTDDMRDWGSGNAAPLGSIMQFNIPAFGLEEQAAVVTSRSNGSSWTFTPVTIGTTFPGEHPVSGNREFGLLGKEGLATRIYTRGADRALDGPLDPSEDVVYTGADNLWKSFQQLVCDYVNKNGGEAAVGSRITKRPIWADVKATGLFARK